MRKTIMHGITAFLFLMLGGVGAVHAQGCELGKTGCPASPPSNPPRQSLVIPQAEPLLECTATGDWQNAYGGIIHVTESLSGTMKLPYCSSSHSLTISPRGTSGFDVNGQWSGGTECQSFTESLSFQDCSVASGTYRNSDGSSGSDTWTREVANRLSLEAAPPLIPTESRTVNKKVLTRSDVTATVTNSAGAPVADLNVALRSSRPTLDTIRGPATPTNSAGQTTAEVETRSQPGESTITSQDAAIFTASPAQITWLPADYEASFLVTCYVLSIESDYASTPLIGPVAGLPAANRYREGFISDVRLQGSGQATDGTIVRYNGNGIYGTSNCALTATGACATDGTTAAVDRSVIPYRSTFSIDTVGARRAQDTGGAIKGYHIDEYFGTRRAECIDAGHRTLRVTFQAYQ